uniref:EF-hand domain-containing protein n=1 Tax=Opuntia streptacantha TaxID=393608 RepID=A0A7C8ZZ59_OPUST
MAKEELSESESTGTSGSDNEPETHKKTCTDYEKQRQLRIADNKARMEALGLCKMANALMGSSKNSKQRKGKPKFKRGAVKEEEDDEYCPNDEDEEGSGADFSDSDEEFDEKIVNCKKSRARSGKVKGKKTKSLKDVSLQKSRDITDFMDEDEALMQAIALSLKDSGELSGMQHSAPSQHLNAQIASINEKEDNTRRRKRKTLSSRVQMTADDLIIHFCQLDEVGKGTITLRDLQRMASVHDFTWTDKELADMIRCFDSDKDGKLTLDDFQNIAMRCNMLQGTESS